MHSSFNNTVGKKIMKRINAFISKKLIIAGIIASSLGVAGAAGAVAFKEGMFAQVSGQQAAATAVAQVGGVAKDVDYKYKQHLGGRYKVEILKDGVEYEALVDAQSGKVLAVAQDNDQDKRHFDKYDKHDKHDKHHKHDNAEPSSSQNTDYQAPADAAPGTPENATASEVTKS